MTLQEYKEILMRYLPNESVDSVMNFLNTYEVRLKIASTRSSKLGDYRPPQRGQQYHAISVNGDLNRYMLLLVLLHEMGHLMAHVRYGRGIMPHGLEWQREYASLLVSYAQLGAFPQESLPLLKEYTSKLPLRNSVGVALEKELHKFDSHPQMTLDQLKVGDCFYLVSRPERHFQILNKRRTRWQCIELGTNVNYLVSGNSPVVKIID